MKAYLDVVLLIGIGIWAVLEFYFQTEFGPLNALILLGVIWRFGVMPSFETASTKRRERGK